MTTPQTEILIDEDTLYAMAAGLDKAREELTQLLNKNLANINEAVNALTVDGHVPPVYKDTSEALRAVAQRHTDVHRTLTDKMKSDAKVLRDQVEKVRDDEHRAANDIKNIDSTLV